MPVTITVNADDGAHFVWIPQDLSWEEHPIVTYTQTVISIDNAEVLRDQRGGGGTESVTFPRPGDHTIVATGVTSKGAQIRSAPMNARVAAAHPPAFTVVSPADGSVVNLDEGGGQVNVHLTTTSDQYFPLSVSIVRDGQTTTEQFTGTQYQKTVILAPMPLGSRTVSVTCADPDGLRSTSSRSVVGHDVAAPHLQVGYPQPSANIIGDAKGAVTVSMHGTAPDNQSGMAGGSATVAWALVPGGPWTAAHPAAGSDFSNWSAEVPWRASARTRSLCVRRIRRATRHR